MDDRTREIIEKFLDSEDFWDKKTRKLRYAKLIDEYREWLEMLFFETVTKPYCSHVAGLIRAITPEELRESHFAWDEHYWGKEGENNGCWIFQMCSENCRADTMGERLQYVTDWYLERKWNNGWDWQGPTEEEVLELGIRPGLVPGKTFKDGAVQVSMF